MPTTDYLLPNISGVSHWKLSLFKKTKVEFLCDVSVNIEKILHLSIYVFNLVSNKPTKHLHFRLNYNAYQFLFGNV